MKKINRKQKQLLIKEGKIFIESVIKNIRDSNQFLKNVHGEFV